LIGWPKVDSHWLPFVGLTGIALPMSFSAQVEPVLYYLKPSELLPLYGTEWLMFAVLGLIATLSIGLTSVLVRSRQRQVRWPLNTLAFAAILGLSLGVSVATIIKANVYPLATVGKWMALTLAIGITAWGSRAEAQATINRLVHLATALSLLGMLSVSIVLMAGLLSGSTPPARRMVASASSDHPHIVLISIDTTAAEHLMPYGSVRPTTPALDDFAHTAVVVDRYHANSNFTTTSVSSFLTSTRPWTHRAVQLPGKPLARVAEHSLPANLQAMGYQTAAFTSNPWAGPERLGLGRYFSRIGPNYSDRYSSCNEQILVRWPMACSAHFSNEILVKLSVLRFKMQALTPSLDHRPEIYEPDQALNEARAWLKAPHRGPTFTWVHLIGPHDPYAADRPWLRQFDDSDVATRFSDSSPHPTFTANEISAARRRALEARYDESLLEVDEAIGAFLKDVRAALGPNTAIIITADHGESFRHDYGGHGGPALYEQLIHIPLIIALPYGERAGTRSDVLSEQIDLAPTVAAIAGVPIPATWEGRNLLGTGDQTPDDRAVYSMNFEESHALGRLDTGSVAILEDHWKLVRFIGELHYPNMPVLETQLFDLAADPSEGHNLAKERPDVVTRLLSKLDAEYARHAGPLSPRASSAP